MSKIEWAILGAIAVLVAIGVAAEPEHVDMAGHDHAGPTMEATPASTAVDLAVSGMT